MQEKKRVTISMKTEDYETLRELARLDYRAIGNEAVHILVNCFRQNNLKSPIDKAAYQCYIEKNR